MCLAAFALRPHSEWVWVVVANRDESHDRPSVDMQPWTEDPSILAGRDLRAGGGWLGVKTDGRFALLTNYREPGNQRADAPSRGHLVENFLKGSHDGETYLKELQSTSQQYNGFNLLLGHQLSWWHASNRAQTWQQPLHLGVHGLSNALLDTPWPKVLRTCQAVQDLLQKNEFEPDLLSAAFQDTRPAPDDSLPQTGISLERERLLSSPFILGEAYGTRCTTVVMQHRDGTLLAQETTYDPDGSQRSKSRWSSHAGAAWESLL